MDQDLLIELSKIRDLLTVIVVLLGILVFGKIFSLLQNIIANWKSNTTTTIRDMSVGLHDRGQYQDLIEYLNGKLKDHPNNATAIFWLARSHLSLEEYDAAKKYLLHLRELEPSWENEHIAPYMNIIDEKH